MKLGAQVKLNVDAKSISHAVISSFAGLQTWAATHCPAERNFSPTLVQANWLHAPISENVDHVITSPPYMTRIDYVMKTLPELSFLSRLGPIDLYQLRNSMLGTVLTKTAACPLSFSRCTATGTTIQFIEKHHSKASSTYYKRFFQNYLSNLFRSLKKIAQFSTQPKTITVVSQGSYYKEILVDLPLIIDEIMSMFAYNSEFRYEYDNRRNIALVNSRSHASSASAPAEVVSIYKRRLQ